MSACAEDVAISVSKRVQLRLSIGQLAHDGLCQKGIFTSSADCQQRLSAIPVAGSGLPVRTEPAGIDPRDDDLAVEPGRPV